MKPQNTRFAPSPTGPPHLGSLRTAYQNWLAARSTGGRFILRIDDTDKLRSDEKYVQDIIDMMNHFGLDYDKIVRQSDRLKTYMSYANCLIDRGLAKIDPDGCIRISDNMAHISHWLDSIAGAIKVSDDDKANINGRVIVKSDGYPAYNFATVVDDIDLDITCIIRGKDHTTNTSFQTHLFHSLMADPPACYHVGLIMNNGKKLSKRDNDLDLKHLMKVYHPDALLNCVIRLGWAPKVDDKTTKILTRERMLDLFWQGGKMKNKNAAFDVEKLKAWDRKYRAMS